jgi:hypothetical protein
MPRTQVSCPNCRQPVMAEIDQLFDVNQDPAAKQRLLSGAFNLIECPNCGFRGNMASPIVYHDADKELLLTFVPAELALPQNDQERLIGGLINQVINHLPQEKRKGYLLRPQATLTMQGLIERVLEADGITKEMIQAQQKRLNLIQRFLSITDQQALEEVAKQEDTLVDAEFFDLLSTLVQTAMAGGDQQSARALANLQKILLTSTTFGRQVKAQSEEYEAAIADLRAAGQGMTRDKLIEIVTQAPNDTRLQALVSLARPGMDYAFFQMLSERIERARGEGRNRLAALRSKLLEMTQEYDRQLEAHLQETRKLIETLLQSEDVGQAMADNLSIVDQYFLAEVSRMLEQARKDGDLSKSSKLQEILDVIEAENASPPELELLEEYLEASGEDGRRKFLEEHDAEITQEFLDMLANLAVQSQASEDKEFAELAMAANRQALRFSMQRSMRS